MTPAHIRIEVDRLMGQVRAGQVSDAWAKRFIGDMRDRLTLGQTLSQANTEKVIELSGRY